MSAPDARTRRKISLQPAKVLSATLGTRAFPRILISNVLFVLATYAAKESLLSYDIGVFWVVMRVLAIGAVGLLIWEGLTFEFSKKVQIEWTVLGISSLLLFLQQAALYTALYRLSSPRVVLFVHFSSSWVGAMITSASISRPLIIASSFILSFLSDVALYHRSPATLLPGYGCLVLHGLATYGLERLRGVLSPSLDPTLTTAASTFGAAMLGLPLYAFRRSVLELPASPSLPLLSLAVLPLLTYKMIFLTPNTKINHFDLQQAAQSFVLSYPSAFLVCIGLGLLGFSQRPHWTDLLLGAMLYYALYPRDGQTLSSSPRTPISRLARFYLNSILSDDESRKIFYFLALNLCYMLVQMLYGVWTNSLGLISDAIHMAFDCMAIGVGLLASVMAKWPPNERFTYGYGRIETLSGFANGIFLILISIFIVFEAVQRLINPPEMSTKQLLLISSLGLGVNLFGMFAMGGHHHHHHLQGHSHGHGHDHSHAHTHAHDQGHTHVHAAHSRSHPDDNHNHRLSEHDPHSHHHDRPREDNPEGSDSHHPLDHDQGYHRHPTAIVASACHSDSRSHSHHQEHEISDDHSHTHADSHPLSLPSDVEHSHKASTIRGRKSHSRGPSLQITPESSQLSSDADTRVPFPTSSPVGSPISPTYPSTLKHDCHPVHHHDHAHHHHHDGHGHGAHSHSHSHDHEGHSHNMRGVFLHVMADTLGSVGVIVSTLLIQYYGWTGFDPIASLFIAILIVASVVPLVIDTGRILSLDLGHNANNVDLALKELEQVEGVASYSSPRFWPKDSATIIGSIRVQLSHSAAHAQSSDTRSNKQSNIDRVLERVNTLLKSRIPGLEEVTIQLEEASGAE